MVPIFQMVGRRVRIRSVLRRLTTSGRELSKDAESMSISFRANVQPSNTVMVLIDFSFNLKIKYGRFFVTLKLFVN